MSITIIYFLYGLSFFSMGLIIILEVGRCSDTRLRYALRFLAAFGLLHGSHEWLEMFQSINSLSGQNGLSQEFEYLRILLLAFSFLPLGEFGVSLLITSANRRRLTLLIPLFLAAFWSFGLLFLGERYSMATGLMDVIDAWTRYSLAIPSALLACTGLIYQQRAFRLAGLDKFGQDSLWAAIAFAWYGVIGQSFPHVSSMFPANYLNDIVFQRTFGFPVQLMRAASALVAAIFVIRFLRSFEVESQHKIAVLQEKTLDEARHREALRGDLLRRVVEAQEAERQRIARELHDATGQALTAIGLGLRAAATQLKTDAEKASQNLRQLEILVSNSLDELQHLIADLRPSHLDDLGLAAALRWYCNDLQKRLPLRIELNIEGEQREVPPEIKTAIFRITQEALTNVVKHAHAEQAEINLFFRNDAVAVSIIDNGCGFDLSHSNKRETRPSWGLLGMKERANLLGGSLILQTALNKGTTVQVTIPYTTEDKEGKDGHTPGIGG